MAAPRKYPDELRERATRMAVELRADPATKQGAIARVAEQLGATACGCDDDCWCRRPGLSVFRWVFPRGHRSAHTAEQKAVLVRDRP